MDVVYALPERQWMVALDLPAGATVKDALSAVPVSNLVPAADRKRVAVGIWGRAVPMHRLLRDGDRVELYRPLRADPKAARRQLAVRQKDNK